MDKQQQKARISIEVPLTLHKQLKAIAALRGTSVKQLVLSSINEHILSKNVPNAETKKALEESDQGIGLVQCDDLNDLLDKLGLND